MAASKENKTVKSIQKKTSSNPIRTIKPPAKPGTIKRSVIRKAVKEIMAEQSVNLEGIEE
jgi:hypothetical protein